MGFLKDSIRRTLFDIESFKSAVSDGDNHGYAIIKITPQKRLFADVPSPTIVGITQDGLSIDFAANWEELSSLNTLVTENPLIGGNNSLLETSNPYLNIAGVTDVGYVFKSQKIYRRSSDIKIDCKLKVVDWNGTGQPIRCALILAALCIPEDHTKNIGLGNLVEKIKNNEIVSSLIKGGENFLEGLKTFANQSYMAMSAVNQSSSAVNNSDESTVLDEPISSVLFGAGGDIVTLMTAAGETLSKKINDLLTLKSSPPPVRVEIGQFFDNPDMVITSVNCSFSKEMTRAGPLYVDFTIGLSSRYIMGTINDVGFKLPNGTKKSKVSFTGLQHFILNNP